MKRLLIGLLVALSAAPRVMAQGEAATSLIAAARTQLDQFNADSASALLERALAPNAGGTMAQRVRAYVLYGIAQLTSKNTSAARQAFRRALQLSPTEKVDSLEFLEPENLLREFNAERAALSVATAPTGLTVDVGAPFDMSVYPAAGRLPITTRTSYRARVVVTVAPAETPAAPVWSNIEMVDAQGAAVWNLRGRDGALVPSGRYVLHVTASDSLGHVATPAELTLVITNPNPLGAETERVRIQAGVLGFATEPAGATAGQRFTVAVAVRDAQGITVSGFHDTVAVAIAAGSGKTGAHLSGTTRLAAVAGIATYADLRIDSAGSDYNLTATATNLTSVTSISFDVAPGAPTRLVFTTEPLTATAGEAFAAVVTVRDASGNTVSGYHDTVTVAIAAGTGRAGARLSGTIGVAASAGEATFGSLSIDSAGAGYTITASAARITPTTSGTFSVLPASWAGWMGLAVGVRHICGLTSGGAAFCWGDNVYGQLGDGSSAQRLTPVAVAGGVAFTALAVGRGHTCGLTGTGAAYCWGRDSLGELGDGANTNRDRPVAVAGFFSFASLTVGGRHTCGVANSGAAYCWGQDSVGELGDAATAGYTGPVAVAGGLQFASLTAGEHHTCGVTAAGDAYCWGWNHFGQLGDGTTKNSNAPVAVSGGLRFMALAAGYGFTCGVATGGATYCWGDNFRGQLGDGSTTGRLAPAAVNSDLRFAALSAGDEHTCGRTSAGAAYCWGANNFSQVGDSSSRERHSPVAVAGGRVFASLTVRDHHSCGLTAGGEAYCWGLSYRSQLGDRTATNPNAPAAVANPY